MSELWNAAERYLVQARTLVVRLSEAQYSAPHAHCYGGSIGGHVRHCLDHFDGFRRGIEHGKIDYDARERGTPEESDPAVAGEKLRELERWFEENSGAFDNGSRLRVKIDCGADDYETGWEDSTVGRELQFIASHTIHHFAIIGIMCDAQSIPVDPEFGVAPSTLKNQQEAQATG